MLITSSLGVNKTCELCKFNPPLYIRVNEVLMLSPRNAQLAIVAMYARVGVTLKTISSAQPFVQGYDNITGGQAAISNFNLLMKPGGSGVYTKIFYGDLTYGIWDDNLGVIHNQIFARYFHDLPGVSYAYSLNYTKTLDSGVLLFNAEEGTTDGVFVQQAGFAGRGYLGFNGYIFDIAV